MLRSVIALPAIGSSLNREVITPMRSAFTFEVVNTNNADHEPRP